MKNYPFHCFECETDHLLEKQEPACPLCGVAITWLVKDDDTAQIVEGDPGDEQT